MNEFEKNMEDILDIDITASSIEKVEDKKTVGKEEHSDADYEYTRGQLYSLIEKGQGFRAL